MNLLKGDIISALELVDTFFWKIKPEQIEEVFIADERDLNKFQLTIMERNTLSKEMILRDQEGIDNVYIRIKTKSKYLKEMRGIIIVYFPSCRGDITKKFKKLLTEKNNNL